MGSGGPRGLQILLSVADRGRGGFDSHTFPPVRRRARARACGLALALVVALAAVLSASAARADMPPIRPDSSGAVPDTGVVSAHHPTPRNAPGERRRPWHATPFAIMARSALVPGWGQAANHRWLKAGVVAGGEGFAAVRFFGAWNDLRAADRQLEHALRLGDQPGAAAAQAASDRAFVRRANAGWVLGIAAALSMMDAYVDAHFIQFDADFGPDPELPDDVAGPSALHARPPTARAYVQLHLP